MAIKHYIGLRGSQHLDLGSMNLFYKTDAIKHDHFERITIQYEPSQYS